MAGYQAYLFAPSSTRVRPCGSKIRTTGQNIDASDNKSHPVTSTNWRDRAAAVSSPVLNGKGKEPARYDENEDPSARLGSETDISFSNPQYRYPRGMRAPWETVVSAPAWQLASSSSSSSGDNQREVAKVQLKHISRIITTVNGEQIPLPNRFSFDVSPVDAENAPSGVGLGELRRLDGGSVPFRRLASEDSDDLMIRLQEIVNANLDILNSTPSSSSEVHDFPPASRLGGCQNGSGSATSVSSVIELEVKKEARFQRMLGRLQKHEPSSSIHEPGDAAVQPHRVVDPAIVAIKVKDDAGSSGRDARSSNEAANAYFAQQLNQMRNAGKQKSTDSGYASKEDTVWAAAQSGTKAPVAEEKSGHTRNGSSLDDGQSKVLNPAAAKFKSAAQNNGAPWLSPKKMSRPPLTNVFPDATTSNILYPDTVAQGNGPPQQPQQTTAPALAGQTHGDRVIDKGTLAQPPMPSSRPIRPPPGFEHLVAQPSMPTSGPIRPPPGFEHLARIQTNAFASINTLPPQFMPPMGLAATVSPATLAGSGLLPTLASAAVPNAPVSATPMAMPGVNAFNTFPPFAGTTATMPVYNQPTPAGLTPYLPAVTPNAYGTTLATQLQAQQPQPFPTAAADPLNNTNISIPTATIPNATVTTTTASNTTSNQPPPRPYFPVTTKPRDHDPVKQQLYEQYLEWRKANEPGYHMKCKMRQAQRVVRQFQQEQEKKSAVAVAVAGTPGLGRGCGANNNNGSGGGKGGEGGSGDWKAIAEKAKAAVGAAARAAEEEKRRREEEVRKELRVKVRELSEGRGGEEKGKGKGRGE
jgi:hypothetical protein